MGQQDWIDAFNEGELDRVTSLGSKLTADLEDLVATAGEELGEVDHPAAANVAVNADALTRDLVGHLDGGGQVYFRMPSDDDEPVRLFAVGSCQTCGRQTPLQPPMDLDRPAYSLGLALVVETPEGSLHRCGGFSGVTEAGGQYL